MKRGLNFVNVGMLMLSCLMASAAWAGLRLRNGSPLNAEIETALPRQTVIFLFGTGAGSLPPEQQGLSGVLLRNLEEGPSTQDATQYRDELFRLNAEVSFAQGARTMVVMVMAPPSALPKTLEKLREILAHPRLDEATFQQSLQKEIANAQASFQDMRTTLAYFAMRDAFRLHPDILDGTTSPAKLRKLQAADLKPSFDKLFSFTSLAVTAVGPQKPKLLVKVLNQSFLPEKASRYRPQVRRPMRVQDYRPPSSTVTILNKPGATDNQVLFIFPEDYQHDRPEYVAGLLAHEILGGGMNGQLAQVLRTERGLTYFAGSRLDPYRPYWTVSSFAGVEQLANLLLGAREVLQKFKTTLPTPSRLEMAKEQRLTQFRRQVELPVDRLLMRNNLRVYGLDPRFVERFEKYLRGVRPQDVVKFVNKTLHLDRGHLYVMGDKDKILESVAKTQAGLSQEKIRVVEVDSL